MGIDRHQTRHPMAMLYDNISPVATFAGISIDVLNDPLVEREDRISRLASVIPAQGLQINTLVETRTAIADASPEG